MKIYIKIEVLAREIESRLLLGLTAVERGHDVLVGDLRALLSHRKWLPPGVFHDKSLTPSSSKIALHKSLAECGFVVTSQDEEHGLLQPDYVEHAKSRFSDVTLSTATASFMWGEHDSQGLASEYPQHASRIIATGSPRADLWRPSAQAFYDNTILGGIDAGRPLVVIAAHGFGLLSVNRFWDELRNLRANYLHGDDDVTEWQLYADAASGIQNLGGFVRMVRLAALRFPDVQFVLRPHPSSADGAWEALLDASPNLAVRRDGTISSWLRKASLVIHDSSTVGLEAAAAGVPLASFWPGGVRPDLISSHLGEQFSVVDDLDRLIPQALEGRDGWFSDDDVRLLRQRLGEMNGPLAADRIVDAWEAGGSHLSDSPLRGAMVRNVVASGHRAVGVFRQSVRGSKGRETFHVGHKFPRLRRAEIEEMVASFQASFGRFGDVRLQFHGGRLFSLRSAAR